jgi:hypothetical protein
MRAQLQDEQTVYNRIPITIIIKHSLATLMAEIAKVKSSFCSRASRNLFGQEGQFQGPELERKGRKESQ